MIARLFIFICCISFFSCEVINRDEEIPSYLHIDSLTVKTDYPTQGTASHKITDAWVYIDDNPIGAFELPATFPILNEGTHQLKIFAGIKENGISSTRIIYPFYKVHSTTVNLKRGETANYSLYSSPIEYIYEDSIDYLWLEKFEGSGISMTKGTNSDTAMVYSSSDIIESTKGVAILDGGKDYFEGVSSVSFFKPSNTNTTFLELNYKSNNDFSVGIYPSNNLSLPYTALNIRSTDTWKKIYIKLNSQLKQINSSKYYVFIQMQKGASISTAELSIDNIKLLKFK